MFKNMDGNIPGGNFLGGNFPGGNFPGGSFPDTLLTIVIIMFAPICDLFSFCYPTQKAVNLSRGKIILF